MSYNLFLDDLREVKDVYWVDLPKSNNWIVVRNYKEFVKCIDSEGCPDFVTFDHDLSAEHYLNNFDTTEKTGYDAAKYLIEYCDNNSLPFPEYKIHSMNIIGRDNIKHLIESYIRTRLK